MKKLMVVLIVLVVFTIPAKTPAADMPCGMVMEEQKGDMKHQGMPCEGTMQMMPMMQRCQQTMLGQSMAMRDMMQVMLDMIRIERKILKGTSMDEKKEILTELDTMKDKLEKMISEMRGVMMKGAMPPMLMPAGKEGKGQDQKEEAQPGATHKH